MKIKINILLFLFLNVHLFGQTNKIIDSLQKEIYNLKSDSLKAEKYYKMSNYSLMNLNELKLCKKYYDSSVYYSKKADYKKYIAKNLYLYGKLNRYKGNYDTAIGTFKACKKYVKMGLIKEGHALFQIGALYSLQGDYENSLKTYIDILSIFEKNKDTLAKATTLNAMAVVYGNIDDHENAITYFVKAKQIFIKKNIKRDIALSYNNIGTMHLRMGDTIKGKKNFLKALKISDEISIDFTKARSLYNLARIYLFNEPKKAINYYFEAAAILEKNEYYQLLIDVYRDIGHFYKYNKSNNKAIKYYKKALILSEKLEVLPSKQGIFDGLSEVYKNKKQYGKAYDYLSKYIIVRDSLFNKENTEALNLLQIQFETEKKDKEIIQQQLALEQKDKEIQKKRTQYSYMIGVASFLLLSSIFIWFVYNQRQKQKNQEIVTLKREHQIKTLETLIEGEEKERLRIAKELHDGVNGDLSAIKFKLSTLLEMNNSVIKDAITMIDNSCNQVRAISHNLVPPSLENFNLVEAVAEYCHKKDESHKETITFQHLGDTIVKLTKKEEINSYRIIQELVSNSLKHAKATEINVQISCRNNIMSITVEDNGIGFEKDQVTGKGIGLSNIQSRMDYLHANVDFISNKQGTSYTIEIDKN